MRVKLMLYGLQRSGTNYLQTLLNRSFRVQFLNEREDRSHPAHKHFRLYDEKRFIPEPQYHNDLHIESFAEFERLLPDTPGAYLVISKDPYSWLISYNNWAQKCAWPVVDHHYIEEYNLFYGRWLQFARQTNKIVFVRYIDLLRDRNTVFQQWQNRLGLQTRFMGGMLTKLIRRVDQSEVFTAEQRDYYIKERYLEEYTSAELHVLNRCIDPGVVTALGYEVRSEATHTPTGHD